MEQRPLPDSVLPPPEIPVPRLAIVPPVDDDAAGDEPELEPAADADDLDDPEAEETEAVEAAVQVQDPLKLYVRSIGGGPLLTRVEERELARRKDEGDEEA